jgi:23S rRNA pseudouridine1911/1915/1917 synthase
MNRYHDHRLSIESVAEPIRLDIALAERLGISRRRIRRAIDEGGVYVNRKRCRKAGTLLKGHEKLRLVMLDDETLIPFDPAQMIWQQPPLYLIHKRSGQYAQEALHRSRGTLPEELAAHLELSPREAKLLRPVHRLDRDTSGLMLLSASPQQLQQLQAMWHTHTEKHYLAVVSPAPAWERERIQLPIGRQRDRLGRYRVEAGGRACDTEAEVLERHGEQALLRLIPHTGRTHQLRVHLSHIGCPILGDARYGGRPHHRLMLHAQMLRLKAPLLTTTHEWTIDPEEDWQW